jgi:hypothetical protein
MSEQEVEKAVKTETSEQKVEAKAESRAFWIAARSSVTPSPLAPNGGILTFHTTWAESSRIKFWLALNLPSFGRSVLLRVSSFKD